MWLILPKCKWGHVIPLYLPTPGFFQTLAACPHSTLLHITCSWGLPWPIRFCPSPFCIPMVSSLPVVFTVSCVLCWPSLEDIWRPGSSQCWLGQWFIGSVYLTQYLTHNGYLINICWITEHLFPKPTGLQTESKLAALSLGFKKTIHSVQLVKLTKIRLTVLWEDQMIGTCVSVRWQPGLWRNTQRGSERGGAGVDVAVKGITVW